MVSYTLLLSVVEYKTLVMRGDMESAAQVLENVPKEELNGIAKFLEAKGHVEEALKLATDPDYKYARGNLHCSSASVVHKFWRSAIAESFALNML